MSEHVRDMSRAHWQRSEAMVLYSNAADALYHDAESALPQDDIALILDGDYPDSPYDLTQHFILTPFERQAYRIGQRLFVEAAQSKIKDLPGPPQSFRDKVTLYTYEGTFGDTLREASRTMAYFPLNVGFTVAAIATDEGIPDYPADNFADIAALLRRDNVRQLISTSAFAINSFWGSLSVDPRPDLREVIRIYDFDVTDNDLFVFDPETAAIQIAPRLLDGIRKGLIQNNKKGISNYKAVIERRTSSGCPARHLRPHFTQTESDQESIKRLTKFFNTSPEQLLAPRARTGIEVGLDYLCDGLERAATIQNRLAATALVAS